MKSALYFLAGIAVGALGTFLYVQKYVIPEIKDNIRKEENELTQAEEQTQVSYTNESVEEDPVVSDYASRTHTQTVKGEFKDYSNYSRDPEHTFMSETSSTEASLKENTGSNSDAGTPYLIDAGSFDEYSGYTAHTFVIFSDGVVIDDESEEILDEDPELVFGKTAMDVLTSGKEDIIYIRNDEKRQDYSLERRDYPFDGPEQTFLINDPNDWGD